MQREGPIDEEYVREFACDPEILYHRNSAPPTARSISSETTTKIFVTKTRKKNYHSTWPQNIFHENVVEDEPPPSDVEIELEEFYFVSSKDTKYNCIIARLVNVISYTHISTFLKFNIMSRVRIQNV